MKKLLTLLFAVTLFLTANAQKTVENSYLSINVPSGWECKNYDTSIPGMEMLMFYNSGGIVYNMGMVLGFEMQQDPAFVLQSRMEQKNNLIFRNAKFGSIHEASFMGKSTQSVDFDTTIDGARYKGAAYAFNEGDCSILCIGCYKVGAKSGLPQIWRSVRWKQKTVKKYNSLREEIQTYTEGLNKMLQDSPRKISDGEQFVSLALEKGEDCIVYTYRLVDFSRSQFDDEQIAYMRQMVHDNMIPELKKQASQTDFLRKCTDANYVFKYVFEDKDGNLLYTIRITPDEYK